MAEDILSLIDKIIEEHRVIITDITALETAANDAGAMRELNKLTKGFVPAHIVEEADWKVDLGQLQETISKLDKGLRAHFGREEGALLTAFERLGEQLFASALRSLLVEHGTIRDRMADIQKETTELASGKLSREVWAGRAWGLRAYINHTHTLVEAHARSEQVLLHSAKQELEKERK